MGVSMSTLNTTTARPPSRVLVTGLGPVGNLAAQIFAACGYEVTAVDPAPARRDGAAKARPAGRTRHRPRRVPPTSPATSRCTWNAAATSRPCSTAAARSRKRGEVVARRRAVDSRRTEIYSFDLLARDFPPLRRRAQRLGVGSAAPARRLRRQLDHRELRRRAALARRRPPQLDGLADAYAPADAQEVYSALPDQSLPTPAALFDWRSI